MREILFKAQRLDNREWVEGFYWNDPDMDDHGYPYPSIMSTSGFDSWRINPKTVCQYTGKRDKNGRRIWGGDEVVVPGTNRKPSVVTYQNGGFVTKGPGVTCEHLCTFRSYQVTGNIFDGGSDE